MKPYLKIFNLAIILLFVNLFVYASVAKNDSLLNLLANQSGTNRLAILEKIFDSYRLSDTDSAGYFAAMQFKEATALHNQLYLVKSECNLGIYYSDKGDYSNAKVAVFKAIEIAKENNLSKELAAAYRIMAGVYYEKGDINNAIGYVYNALNIYENNNDAEGVVSCYNNIGLFHDENSEHNYAIESYKKGLSFIEKYHLKKQKADFFTNLGVAYRSTNEIDSSYFYHKKAMEENIENNSDYGLVSNYLNIAQLFAFEFRQKDSASYYFNRAYSAAKNSYPGSIPAILNSEGEMYYSLNEYDKAIEYLGNALKISVDNRNLREQEVANYYLYKACLGKKQYPDAIKYLEDLVDVQDSIGRNEAKVKISRLQEKYENEKKELKIEQLETSRKLDKTKRILLLVTIFLISIIFVIIVAGLIVGHKRAKEEKENLKKDLKQKNKQLTSQALMMMQKNKLLNDILIALSDIKNTSVETNNEIRDLKRKLKRSMHSEKDWDLFKQYFELVNKDFFDKIKQINKTITPAELKLSALIKLRFNIKETAALLNISQGSVKSSRYILRKKFGLNRQDNIYEFLNSI